MDIPRLRYFLEVARQKNFTRASAACRISQPSLSQQIKKLEEEVGGELFVRARGGVVLSPLGETFLKYAQAIMAEVGTAEEFVAQTHQQEARTVRLGAIPTIAPFLLPEVLEAIRARLPGARFELVEHLTEHLIESLRTGEVDFALLSPPTAIDGECDHLPLHRDELLLTLPEGHRLCSRPLIRLEDLAGEKIILLEHSHCLSQQAAALCAEAGLSPDVSIRSSQIDTLLRLVERGFGLTFTPSLAVQAHPHRRVVHRSIGAKQCSREVRMVWLPRHYLSRTQEAVIRAVREAFPRG